MTVLVVDDSRATRQALRHLLQSAGYADVALADSGTAALAMVAAAPPGTIDLVLLDLNMPAPDGIHTLRALKATEEGRALPVLVVTATPDHTAIEAAFDAGASDFIEKPFRAVALLARIRAALALKKESDRRRARERELMAATRRLGDLNRELERRSSEDGLTGLANRGHLDRTLELEWRRAIRSASPLSLILVDADHFKQYNDRYGHLEGDACLRAIGNALRGAARRPADLAARYGGEELAILLPDTDAPGALVVAEQVRARIEALELRVASGEVTRVTVSAGVATLVPQRGEAPTTLIAGADAALYQAKRAGRNRCVAHGALLQRFPRASEAETAPPPMA